LPNGVEGKFSELRLCGVLGSSLPSHGTDFHGPPLAQPDYLLDGPAALSGEVALVICIRPGLPRRFIDKAIQGAYGTQASSVFRREILQCPFRCSREGLRVRRRNDLLAPALVMV
jgi:hypothetical protein